MLINPKKEHNIEIETVDDITDHTVLIKIEGEDSFITQNF